jgi:hypothetical protein
MQEVSSVGGSAAPSRERWGASTPNHLRFYSVADRILCFQGDHEPVLRLVHDFLGGYYFTPTESSAGPAPAHTIELHTQSPPLLPAPESSFEIEDGYCYPNDEQLVLAVNGSTIVVGPPELNRTDIWLSETTAARHPLALNNVILYAVQSALRRAGLYQFHAGCVLQRAEGKGILLVGDSGCGKSTLTATLLSHGWNFVSDDNLMLTDRPTGIVAWALRRYFTFDEPTLKACNLLQFADAVGGRVPGEREKIRFHARTAFPESFVESCSPGVILFPSIGTEANTRLEPVKQGDALTRLIRQCPWATCDAAVAPQHLQVLARLISQTRSYSIVAGSDVFESPTTIPDLIAQLDA